VIKRVIVQVVAADGDGGDGAFFGALVFYNQSCVAGNMSTA